jgi:NADH pyrophosphatase NudC (nudix superfamily)
MQLVAILISLGILIFVGMYLYAPFLDRRARRVTAEEHEISALLAERERAITALQELDFDYKLGKVPEEDYPTQRAALLQRGAEILRRLDEFKPEKAAPDNRVERAVATRRQKLAMQPVSDDEIENLIAGRRKVRKTKSAGFCPNCGKSVLASDKFCPSCGRALA